MQHIVLYATTACPMVRGGGDTALTEQGVGAQIRQVHRNVAHTKLLLTMVQTQDEK